MEEGQPLPALDGQTITWTWSEQPPPGMRAVTGQPCPYPGLWHCEDTPAGPHSFQHGMPLPPVQGREVTWFLVKAP